MKLFNENPFFFWNSGIESDKMFETVRLSVSISPRNLYNSLKSIKEIPLFSHLLCADVTWSGQATLKLFIYSSSFALFISMEAFSFAFWILSLICTCVHAI